MNPDYQLVNTRHGRMIANPNDYYIGRALIKYGEFSELEWQLLAQLVKPGHTVIEAGANIGAHTVSLARAVGYTGRVWAFEPQHILYQNLCANLALNSLTNTYAFNAGCGDKSDEITLPDIHYAEVKNFGGIALDELNRKDGTLKIPVHKLDDIVTARRVDLIKIDVEGMEEHVLKGAKTLIENYRPVLYVENDRDETSESLIHYLMTLDYRLWWHCPPIFNPENFNNIAENDYRTVVSVNMLCLPKDSTLTVTDFVEIKTAGDRPF